MLKGRIRRSHRGPGLAGRCSAAKQEPIPLLQGIVVRLVGLLWGGKCWNSWPMGSMSTTQNVFKGFSSSCLITHVPHQVSSQDGRKKPVKTWWAYHDSSQQAQPAKSLLGPGLSAWLMHLGCSGSQLPGSCWVGTVTYGPAALSPALNGWFRGSMAGFNISGYRNPVPRYLQLLPMAHPGSHLVATSGSLWHLIRPRCSDLHPGLDQPTLRPEVQGDGDALAGEATVRAEGH